MESAKRTGTGLDKTIYLTSSVGVQTPAEIEELSLRTPRPVATTE
ncbi:hypothetical protein [Lysinibacillus sp. NPDC093688]